MSSLNPNPRKLDRVLGSTQSMLQVAVTTRRSVIVDKGEDNIPQWVYLMGISLMLFTIFCFIIMFLGML